MVKKMDLDNKIINNQDRYKQSINRLSNNFDYDNLQDKSPNAVGMLYTDEYFKKGFFGSRDFDDLSSLVEFVEITIPKSEWRRQMSILLGKKINIIVLQVRLFMLLWVKLILSYSVIISEKILC